MSPELQHTLAGPAGFSGIAIHSGEHVRVVARPAAADEGIRFLVQSASAGQGLVPARSELVRSTKLGTTIANSEGVAVATIEHLMAALWALGIDNALIEIDGGEVPVLDGSTRPIIAALEKGGRRPQRTARQYIEVLEEVEVVEGERSARLSPAEGFEVAYEIDFDHPAVGRQKLDLIMDEAVFRAEIAAARTFGFASDLDKLRACGLARGASLDNVVAVGEEAVLNPEGLRWPDEFVRHKILDAVGDLYLLGGPLIGRYHARLGGHELNDALAKALLASPRSWRRVEAGGDLAQAG
ncbi:MAG: UDP-3-O-acyl-N-acetylglucosamine deacetylase [Caulobacteraceae bacterium]